MDNSMLFHDFLHPGCKCKVTVTSPGLIFLQAIVECVTIWPGHDDVARACWSSPYLPTMCGLQAACTIASREAIRRANYISFSQLSCLGPSGAHVTLTSRTRRLGGHKRAKGRWQAAVLPKQNSTKLRLLQGVCNCAIAAGP